MIILSDICNPMANKSRKNTTLWLVGIAAVGFIAFKLIPLFKKLRSAKKVGDNLILNVANVDLKNRGIVFKAINPTSGELSIDSIGGDILADGSSIATFSKFEKIEIKPNSETNFTLNLKISPIGFASVFTNIISMGADRKKVMNYLKSIKLTAKGSANVGGIIIPIEQKIYN